MSKANREKRTSVRANTAKYTPEKPLFGKYVGSVYRPEHERGVPENGTANKDLEIIQIRDNEEEMAEIATDNFGHPVDKTAHAMFFDNSIVCPYCKFEYVHFRKPRFTPGEDDYKASGIYDIGVRGSVIVLPFNCENGHEWVLVLGFHKGNIRYKIILTGTSFQDEE